MDVINDYVSKALIADNRGGLNVEKILVSIIIMSEINFPDSLIKDTSIKSC